ARRAAAGREPDADRDLALPPQGRAGAHLPARAGLLQPRQFPFHDGERRRPGELLEVPHRPAVARRRVGQLSSPLRARRRKAGRHPGIGARHGDVRSTHAQPDEGLARIHDRGRSTMSGNKAANSGSGLQAAVEEFLYRQAEFLDGKQWQDYIDLFTADGTYWMPADPAHTHWDGVPSIFAEDCNLMTVRMKRILHPDAWSQKT